MVKIYWYAKDPYEAKHLFLINKRKSAGLKHLNNSNTFLEYSNDIYIYDIYKNIEEHILNKKSKILIIFGRNDKSLGRKLNISLVLLYSLILQCQKKLH